MRTATNFLTVRKINVLCRLVSYVCTRMCLAQIATNLPKVRQISALHYYEVLFGFLRMYLNVFDAECNESPHRSQD